MSEEMCEKHTVAITAIEKDVAIMRRDLEHIMGRICSHIQEAEATGGWRDKMVSHDKDIEQLKRDRLNDLIIMRWFMVGSGVMSGLIVSGCVEFTKTILGILK